MSASACLHLHTLLALLASSVFLSSCATTPTSASAEAALLEQTKAAYGNWAETPASQPAARQYHAALSRLVTAYDGLSVADRQNFSRETGLAVTLDETGERGLYRFSISSKGDTYRLNHCHSQPGVGIPVVAWRPNDGTGAVDSHRPPEGIFASLTAWLEPSSHGKWTLKFLSPDRAPSISLGDQKLDLATNLSAPIATVAGLARPLSRSGRGGMLNPTGSVRREKLYLIQPYDPEKIPLVMVHGLQSTPVAFANLMNDLIADPQIRSKYQVWHYHYPTGTPVLQNAAVFRDVLKRTLQDIDPEGDDFATRNLVVIGHSMGGLLTHTLVCDSGYKLWDSVISLRPERLDLPKVSKEGLDSIYCFQRDRRVKRVIFIAAPHRGSLLADNWIGDLGQRLFRPDPITLPVFSPLVERYRDHVNPFVVRLVEEGKFSSIRTLSAQSPALLALAEIRPAVPFHSIIGQLRPGAALEGSDGVVPYTSSHLEGADSELIVPYNHNAFKSPEAVAEVARILRLHLNSL